MRIEARMRSAGALEGNVMNQNEEIATVNEPVIIEVKRNNSGTQIRRQDEMRQQTIDML